METEKPTDQPNPDGDAAELDVEGHTRIAALFVSTTARPLKPNQDGSTAKGEETVTPLTKPFPRMRDERRK